MTMNKSEESIGELSRKVISRVSLAHAACDRYYTSKSHEDGYRAVESALFHLQNAETIIRRQKRQLKKQFAALDTLRKA